MLKRSLLLFTIVSISIISFAIPPYYYFGELETGQESLIEKMLGDNGFDILGSYNPMGSKNIKVIAFTNNQLTTITSSCNERGTLAAVLKIAIISEAGKPNIYLLNPEYIFWAYLGDDMKRSSISDPLNAIDQKVKNALEIIGVTREEMGGNIKKSDLGTYRYMFGMERYTDPITLKTFESFNEGIKQITENAKAGKGTTKLVYQLIIPEKEVAIFGIGLLDKEKGEPDFLPIVGETHAAALPYEIILNGNKATMLHGRYRIALHWPELTMVTFSKIMSTPGNIESQLKLLTE